MTERKVSSERVSALPPVDGLKDEMAVDDAPNEMTFAPCHTYGWRFPDRVKYGVKYLRAEAAEARISSLEEENKRLEKRLKLADELIADMAGHDGAEGFSLSTYQLLDQWYNN